MKIIDTHTHIGGESLGFKQNEEMLLEMIRKYNINYCIVSNGDCAELDHNQRLLDENKQVTQEDGLIRSIKLAKRKPEQIGVAVWVKPFLQTVTPGLRELIKENRSIIKAIKLHPYHSNLSPVDKRVLPYLELAEEFSLPVVSHTGGCEAASPFHLYEAARAFPSIPFVMVHMGLGTDNREALNLLGKADNLYGDTTWVPMSTTLEAIRRYGSGKMMFGSDAPIDGLDTYLCNPEGKRSVYQDYFYVLPEFLTEDEYDDIMYENAKKIFKI